MLRTLALVSACLCFSVAATAQPRTVEISGGYTFVHDAKNDISLPAGWIAGGAVTITGWLAAAADVSGSFKAEEAFGTALHFRPHAIVGGGRVHARLGRATEFAQVLAGVVRGSGTAFGFTDATNAFAVQPGVGLDYPLNDRLAARGQLDVRFIRNQPEGNEAGYEYRFSAAVVYRIR